MKKVSIILSVIILAIIIIPLLYEEPKVYVYYTHNKFGKSSNCYIDAHDRRICKIKGQYKVVEMYYYEEL